MQQVEFSTYCCRQCTRQCTRHCSRQCSTHLGHIFVTCTFHSQDNQCLLLVIACTGIGLYHGSLIGVMHKRKVYKALVINGNVRFDPKNSMCLVRRHPSQSNPS